MEFFEQQYPFSWPSDEFYHEGLMIECCFVILLIHSQVSLLSHFYRITLALFDYFRDPRFEHRFRHTAVQMDKPPVTIPFAPFSSQKGQAGKGGKGERDVLALDNINDERQKRLEKGE